MNNPLQVLSRRLSDQAIHVDFLRLRCGSEEKFRGGIRDVRAESRKDIHTFISFSEWDAVVIVPSSELYPHTLTEIYANTDVSSSVSGTSGYFAYLWEHPVNTDWRETLTHCEKAGPTILMSLRFADWFRREAGLGAEILFCDYLQQIVEQHKKEFRVVVAHSLGWNDVILLLHFDSNEARLTEALADIRLTTLEKCLRGASLPVDLRFPQSLDNQIFAASYSHLLGGFDRYMDRDLSFGTLASQIESARLLVRVAPPHEHGVRKFLDQRRAKLDVKVVPSEMGHYSLSLDISSLTPRGSDGREAILFVADTREIIGQQSGGTPDSYAETTTIFRFIEPEQARPQQIAVETPAELQKDIAIVEGVMRDLPHLLRQRRVSSMTSHRFISVLTTLMDHLSDPVRSSVVRHLSRFAETIPDLVRELDRDGIDDLCHVIEYAVGQAIDGIAQFQHDANALGLSGRGGYSRLIATVEWYIHATFARLGMPARLPLITFGLRSGNAGSTGRYQIDIPFNVLFVPSRWHILLHEIGHLAWLHTFGWMMESLAIYRAMEREIRTDVRRRMKEKQIAGTAEQVRARAAERVQVEFLRTREIVREIFPSYLMFALPCAGNIDELDALALRHMLTIGHPSSLTRELLIRVVTHCLLVIMSEAMKEGGSADPGKKTSDEDRAAAWWGIWESLLSEKHDRRVLDAVESMSETMKKVDAATWPAEEKRSSRPSSESRRGPHVDSRLGAKTRILNSPSFKAAVQQALSSAILVLALRARHFRELDADHIGPPLFGKLLQKLLDAQDEQSNPAYTGWLGPRFAEWLHAGEVLPEHRASFVWSRLLLGSRSELVSGGEGSFMRSQLSVLLSMWHDAITQGHRSKKKLERIVALGVVREKETLAAGEA
jgi:hypothetical protein